MKTILYLKSTIILLLLAGNWHCQYEEVEPLYADFSVQGGIAQALAPVTFTDASEGARTWAWNFGNGNASNSKTPPDQTYPSQGGYTVSLTVTNGAGASDTKTISLSVGLPPDVLAQFSLPANARRNEQVSFTNNSLFATDYQWDFGSGVQASTEKDPVRSFPATGTRSVTLTASNSKGSDTQTKTIEICDTPVAAFTTPNNGTSFNVNANIAFNSSTSTLNASDGITTYSWDFGNGQTSDQKNPTYAYPQAGTYTVRLLITNPCGADWSDNRTLTITGPQACFTVNNNNCLAPCTVSFSNCSTNASTYLWNFGDGTTSMATNPTKTYNTAGTYTVQLTATSASGASSTTTQQININGSSNAPAMKSIPAGTFIMGCNSSVDPNCESLEQPTPYVTLSAYQISETEVTQAQWQGLMGDNPSVFTGCAQCPVERVSWYDAVVYCNRLSESLGLEPCYYSNPGFTSVYGKSGNTWSLPNSGQVYWKTSAKGYRLPTEAEWERAARDGVQNRIYSGGNDVNAVAWYSSNSGGGTQPVKQKPVNGTPNYKLYDMSGNVFEWCFDWFDNYPSANQTNPTGPTDPNPNFGSARVLRGGSWFNDPAYCRVALRGSSAPDNRSSNVGFRLARTF